MSRYLTFYKNQNENKSGDLGKKYAEKALNEFEKKAVEKVEKNQSNKLKKS